MIFEKIKFNGLTPEGARKYYRAKIDLMPFIKEQIINPFEKALKKYTGYNDKKIPNDVVKTEIECSAIPFEKFVITTKPTTKRPGYSAVYGEIENLLYKLSNEPLVPIKSFLKDIRDYKESITSRGVEQKISPDYDEFKEELEKVDLSIIEEPKKAILIPASGLMYLRAGKIYSSFAEYVSNFETALKKEAGIGEELEEKVKLNRQIGNTLFVVRATPYETTEYGKIVNGFIEELSILSGERHVLPKTKTAQEKAIEKYNDLKEELEEDYQVIAGKDNKAYIALEKLVGRFSRLKNRHSDSAVNCTINFYSIA